MANFDLVGKLRLKFEEAELNKLQSRIERMGDLSSKALGKEIEKGLVGAIKSAERQAERFVQRIENDMARVARSANRSITKSLNTSRSNTATALKENILLRDKFLSQQSSKQNKIITSEEDRRLKDFNNALKENILLRDRFISKQAANSNVLITQKEVDNTRKQADALRENILLRDRFISQEASKANALITERETDIIKKQSDALRENILLRDQFITEQASRQNAVITKDVLTEGEKRAAALRENILQRDEFIASQAAEVNKKLTKEFDDQNQERINSLRESILERNKLQQSFKPTKTNTIDSDPSFQFGQQSALAFKRFAAFSLAAGSVFELIQAFKFAIKESITFESELVKLAQVSGSSIKALGATRKEIDRLSTSLGTSSKDLVQSAVTIRQAGFSIQETNQALETLALTSLSPSFNDIKNTTEGLIALKSQFGTTADDFKRQFGEINAVSKAFAVESEDIVTAIRKTGGAFKVASGNVTELIALFTAVRATTRESADTIATGFRTIFARLQRPQIINELKSFNIELRDIQGNFVGPIKAIEEINRALSDVGQQGNIQFARVAEQIGGIRQISKVVPLIQQFTVAQRAANIARLGANSLDEDAEIAQQSLANRLTKTREKFLEFARGLTINDQFKTIINGLLKLADSVTSLGKSISPVLPSLAAIFALSQLPNAGRFSAGFADRLNLGKGIGGFGTQLALSGFFGQGVAQGFTQGPTLQNARRSKLLNIGVPAAAIGLGIGGALLGDKISSGGPTSRGFVGGRTLSGISSGALGAGLGGAAFAGTLGLSTPVGAGLFAVVGGAIAGIQSFSAALQEATDALEDSKFQPAFTALTETLSEISAGRLSPLGRRDTLSSGLSALRDRRLTATGAERDELRGNVRQTVESLLLFQQTLLDNVKTLEEFNRAGGDEAIRFISENSILTAKELEKQRDAALKNREREDIIFQRVLATQERLLAQANLINSFGAALSDAQIATQDLSERFTFLSNLAFGGNIGVRFRGVPGFGQQTDNPNIIGRSASQIAGLIGLPQFQGLAQQAVASANVRRQLPSILSEFGIQRPGGGNTDELDIFVRERLEQIIKDVPGGAITLQPIVDSIVDSISGQLATQGKGQSEAIQEIVSAPMKFVEKIFSDTDLNQINDLLTKSATEFANVFNNFSGQLSEILSNELAIRKEQAATIARQSDVLTEIAQRRNPRDFPIGQLRAGRLAQAQALLGPNSRFAGRDTNSIIGAISGAQNTIRAKELELQKAKEINQIKSLTEEILTLQAEVIGAKDAFDILVDASDEIAAKFHEFDRIQLERDQRAGGANQFIFGDRSTRNGLNQALIATQLAAVNPDAFFNPAIISDSLRPVIGDFLDQFSELEILPGLKGRDVRQNLLQRGGQLAGINPQFLQDLREGPNARQEELLKQAADLARKESEARNNFLTAQRNDNTNLALSIEHSLQQFVTDLRTNLLQGTEQSTRTRLDSINVDRAKIQEQLSQFNLIKGLGGSNSNIDNKAVLDLAVGVRNRKTSSKAIFDLQQSRSDLSDIFVGRGNNGIADSEFQKILKNLQNNNIFNNFTNDLRSVLTRFQAESLSLPVVNNIGDKLDLDASTIQSLRDQLFNSIAEAADAGSGQVDKGRLATAIIDIIDRATDKASENVKNFNSKFVNDLEKFNAGEKNFFEVLTNLPEDKFNNVAKAINSLGDAKLDKVTEQFNKLNTEANALSLTLQGLTGQIQALRGGGGAQQVTPDQAFRNFFSPEGLQGFLQGITQGISNFVNGSTPFADALNNFPRTVELSANHNVNVTINGGQVLAEMLPAIQSLIVSETNKAIQNFATNNLPGLGSFAQ